jgi:hypothetical protein
MLSDRLIRPEAAIDSQLHRYIEALHQSKSIRRVSLTAVKIRLLYHFARRVLIKAVSSVCYTQTAFPWTPKLVARGLRVAPAASLLSLQSALRISTLADEQGYCWAMSRLLQATSKHDSRACGFRIGRLVERVGSGCIDMQKRSRGVWTQHNNNRTGRKSMRIVL